MLLNNKELKILTEFTSDYNGKLYGSAIASKLNMIQFKQEGKNKYYFLNKLNPSTKEMIKLVEVNKRIILFEKYKKISPLFSEIEKKAKGITIIFGSYANFTKNEKSDLDVFSVGSISEVSDLE